MASDVSSAVASDEPLSLAVAGNGSGMDASVDDELSGAMSPGTDASDDEELAAGAELTAEPGKAALGASVKAELGAAAGCSLDSSGRGAVTGAVGGAAAVDRDGARRA